MRALLILVLVGLTIGCTKQVALPPLPEFTSVLVAKGATVSKTITEPEVIVALRVFVHGTQFKWRKDSSYTQTSGDVAVVLYHGKKHVELIQFSSRLLIVGDYVTDLRTGDVDALLFLLQLSRYDAFTPDVAKTA